MCHDDDSRPPTPPINGGVAARDDLRLTAADGNQLLAHGARAAKPTGIGVVVMPDVRGLHDYYRELAARFAEAGIDAVAVDYFGRSAQTDDRTEAFEFMPHVGNAPCGGWATVPSSGVVPLEQVPPGPVTQLGGALGRPHDVREQHSREEPASRLPTLRHPRSFLPIQHRTRGTSA